MSGELGDNEVSSWEECHSGFSAWIWASLPPTHPSCCLSLRPRDRCLPRFPPVFPSGRGGINQGRGWGGSGNWKLGRSGTLESTGRQNCRAVKESSGQEPGFARVSGREAKIDLLLGLWERLWSWGRDQGLCMDNVEVPVVGRGYHTWSRQILAVRDAASPPSFTHLPARKAEPPAPPPPPITSIPL